MLAQESQTWVSRHLLYTHGYGMVMIPVHQLRPSGRPDWYLLNIPPESLVPELKIARPAGLLRTADHGPRLREHHPGRVRLSGRGEENAYTTYDGEGGVRMDNLLKLPHLCMEVRRLSAPLFRLLHQRFEGALLPGDQGAGGPDRAVPALRPGPLRDPDRGRPDQVHRRRLHRFRPVSVREVLRRQSSRSTGGSTTCGTR